MTFGKRSGAIAAVVTGATLVPLVAFGGVGLAKNSPSGAQYQYPGANQYKVTICHHTHSKKKPMHTITVSANAVKAHLKHGDTLGACPAAAPAASTTAPTHGNNGDNGNHGNGNNGKHGKQ
jgi:hypothetical protein